MFETYTQEKKNISYLHQPPTRQTISVLYSSALVEKTTKVEESVNGGNHDDEDDAILLKNFVEAEHYIRKKLYL